MPKVYLTQEQKKNALYESKNRHIKGEIKKQMDITGMKPKQLKLICGLCEGTFYKRLNNPDQFTLNELRIFVWACNSV